MVGVVAERYIADGVLVTQQMVDAGSVTRWMVDSTLEEKQTWVGSKLSVLSVLCSSESVTQLP